MRDEDVSPRLISFLSNRNVDLRQSRLYCALCELPKLEHLQADYYEGWGLHGRFLLIESVVMDCLSEDVANGFGQA